MTAAIFSQMQAANSSPLPPPPEGFSYVVDGSGNYFVTQGGAYVIQEIA